MTKETHSIIPPTAWTLTMMTKIFAEEVTPVFHTATTQAGTIN